MTARRIQSVDTVAFEKDRDEASLAIREKSGLGPAVPASVILKLLGFTFAMIVGPIGTYFATLHTIFKGNSTVAGAAAAVIANVVLVGYILVAMREDQSEALAAKENIGKKTE
ncbi:MAG: vacuolar ATPase assembly integral membrane protein vma21 [Pycnora praestabilis]|nr:MAG: vacuolar ATPase assembly integral membrane protein vma21 [Pycnora praestabilis]